jgi:hypothetical protein
MEDQIKQIIQELTCYDFYDMPDPVIAEIEEQKTQKLLALFTQSVEENIIGPDEQRNFNDYENTKGNIERWSRNQLRAEQRARLATLIKQ